MNAHIVDLNKEHHHGGVDIDVAIHGPSRPNGSIPLRGSTTIEVRRVNNMYQLSQMQRCVMAAEGSSVGREEQARGMETPGVSYHIQQKTERGRQVHGAATRKAQPGGDE